MKIIAILLAAGNGKRFGSDKILHTLHGKSIISYSLEIFEQAKLIDEIVIVASKENKNEITKIAKKFKKVNNITEGGNTRFASSKKGFLAIEYNKENLLLFHNAANPFVTLEEIENCINLAKKYGASGVGHKVSNTIRILGKSRSKIIPRENAFLMETPQILKMEIFKKGAEIAEKKKLNPTDDLMLSELVGITPKIIEADKNNQKITFADDLKKAQINPFLPFEQIGFVNDKFNFTIGIGQDSHKFSNKGKCILGGLEFSDCPKLMGNSDGDAALHALTNAILSALGEGSLSNFADKMCKNGITNSVGYLKVALKKLKDKNGEIENCSLSFECLRPKLEKSFDKMRTFLSAILKINKDKIGLTATTGEKLTSFGKGEGVQVFASVLLKESLNNY